MAGYSLTVTRPTRIGRVTPPSGNELRAAQAQESTLTQAMAQPGANQMIGYRFNAEQNRISAEQDYDEAAAEHSSLLSTMREEDRRRALEDRADQQQHALRTAVINNPAGASASADEAIRSLLRPEAIEQFNALRQSQINENNRPGQGRGGVVAGAVTARDTARITAQQLAQFNREVAQINAQHQAAVSRITPSTHFREADRQAAIAVQDRLRDQRLQELRTRLQPAQAGAAPAQAGATVAPAQAPAPVDPAVRLEQARRALARNVPRAEVERVLREQGVDPRLLNGR